MRKTAQFAAITGLALGLAACGDNAVYEFTKPVGNELDEGRFGNPTMNNVLIQTGQRSALTDLSNRFAREVDSTITFAFNSSRIDATAARILDRQASWIQQFPEVRFRVYGHTDLVGGNAYNKRLGLARANAVVNYFAQRGISRSRLEAVTSLGETQPLIVTQGRERRNRRTVTEVTGFVQGLVDPLNGEYARIIYREYVERATAPPSIGGGGGAAATAEASVGQPE